MGAIGNSRLRVFVEDRCRAYGSPELEAVGSAVALRMASARAPHLNRADGRRNRDVPQSFWGEALPTYEATCLRRR